MTTDAKPLATVQIEELETLLARSTPGPLVAEKSMRDDCSVHFAIRTAEPMPEHPWSPRFVAWLTGLLRDYLPPSQRPRWRFCETCQRGYWEGRAVPVEVRDDPQVEADALLFVALHNAAPSLLASARAHASALARAEAAEARAAEAVRGGLDECAAHEATIARMARELDATRDARYAAARAVITAERDRDEARAERDDLDRKLATAMRAGMAMSEAHEAALASAASLRERVRALEEGLREALDGSTDGPACCSSPWCGQDADHDGECECDLIEWWSEREALRALLAPTKEEP